MKDIVKTDRENYLASNPAAKELQDAQLKEFHERFVKLISGLNPILFAFVDRAEQARQIGIVLIELAESLPGRRITPDFYHQMKPAFTTADGRVIELNMIEWFIKQARSHTEPIDNIQTALRWNQTLLLASGEPEFQLELQTIKKERVQPKDELGQLQSWLEYPELVATWNKLKGNPKYFQNGHLRESLRETMAEEFRETMKVIEEIKIELGL